MTSARHHKTGQDFPPGGINYSIDPDFPGAEPLVKTCSTRILNSWLFAAIAILRLPWIGN